jgi:mitochondrial fission protein ELM1
MTPLKIAAFFDGRPGHEKQTTGVLAALEKLTPLTVEAHRLVAISLSSAVMNWGLYLTAGLSWKPAQKHSGVDLIIGTGSHTHLPMLLFKNKHRGKTVTCMTPNFPIGRKIDLCLVPVHDGNKPCNNLFFTLGPPVNVINAGQHNRRKGLILVGGIDKKRHRWHSRRTVGQIEMIINKQPHRQWTISSSPRTPNDTIISLRKLAKERRQVHFFTSSQTEAGWIENAYTQSQDVWVTADSISMVYEALTAGCRVGLLPIDFKRKKDKFHRSMDYLLKNELAISLDMWLNGKPMISGRALDEAHRCAQEILRRWWPDRLPLHSDRFPFL